MSANRTARLAVLGSSVHRAASYSSRNRSATRRRIAVALLALVSLALITIHFRESPGGALHDAQGAGAAVLRPFQVAAERVARPFRDAYGYFEGVVGAKSENERLRAEVEELRQKLIRNATAAEENAQLREALAFQDSPTFPKDYAPVHTRVTGYPADQYEQQVTIAAGSDHGVAVHDPVMTPEGLVGQVTRVTGGTALVTLLTDATSNVSALVIDRNATGLVRNGHGDALVLDRVTKDREVRRNDLVVTAGSRVGRLRSIYPRGLPIGIVTSVGQTDTDYFKQIQLTPFVDFSGLHAVTVLTKRKRAEAK